MSDTWGRIASAGTWPRPRSLWAITVVVVALLTGAATAAYQYAYVWTPLQRLYLSTYVRSAVVGTVLSTGTYRLLHVVSPKESRMALEPEVELTQTSAGELTYVLTPMGRKYGAQRVAWVVTRRLHRYVYEDLQRFVYENQGPIDLVRAPLWRTVIVMLVGLLVAIPADAMRARVRRHGRRLKGPELVTAARFNRRLRADGVGFRQAGTWLSRLVGRVPVVRLPSALEPHHVLIMGDTGTGKSTLIRQLLNQIAQRGDLAIVYDPALEYIGRFYCPERGDVILNPLDARCPYWSPGDEVRESAGTTSIAAALFQVEPNETRFFVEAARRIFAHLLTYRPTAHDVVQWLTDSEELTRRVQGTPSASMVDPAAPQQRAGVIASLNMVSDALALLPTTDHVSGRWSASAWAQNPHGWIFLTSEPETRDRLRPLISLWLDLLVMRLLHTDGASTRRVWFILDELASLHRLPQLHTAITENRKANCPLVLGFQGRSQIETRYGHDAEAILSQPATKVFLRTSEPRAAQWIADTIGAVEIERLRESRSEGREPNRSFGLERHVEPLVMASEIGGLANLRGYLKVVNLVVRLDLRHVDQPAVHPGFIPRAIAPVLIASPSVPSETSSPAAAVAGTHGHEHAPEVGAASKDEPFFR